MDDPKDIDEVLLILQRERPVLTKDKHGQVGNQKTRYADLGQVNAVVLGRLVEMDTIWVCRPHIEAGVFGLHYQLRHVPSGTQKDGVWPLKLSENPQQMGSATSYGRRYALLAITGIVSEDEDDDGAAASAAGRTSHVQRAQPQRATTPRPTAGRASAPALPGETRTGGMDDRRRRKMMALFGQVEITDREKRLAYVVDVIGREVETSNDLTVAEQDKVIASLESWIAQSDPTDFDGAS